MIRKRVVNLWRAMVGESLTNLEVDNAESLLELEREELRKKVSQYNMGLSGYAAISEKLAADLKRLGQERTQLEPRLRARLQTGDRGSASRLALRLETIDEQLSQLATQRAENEQTYKELSRARDVALGAARDRIEALKREIGDLRVQESLADLSEIAAGMQGSLGVSDATLERLREGVSQKRNLAAGRARVARDAIDTSDLELRESEQLALAEAALERFERSGLNPESL